MQPVAGFQCSIAEIASFSGGRVLLDRAGVKTPVAAIWGRAAVLEADPGSREASEQAQAPAPAGARWRHA